jgi:hypothetical protein
MINSFQKIGMPDPFAEDAQMMTTETDQELQSKVLKDNTEFIYPESRNDPY